jgi:tetratricopeptide (TPR) repeat protein
MKALYLKHIGLRVFRTQFNAELGEAYYYRGRWYRELEQYSEAIADFTRALELFSTEAL